MRLPEVEDALGEAIEAADALGLETAEARSVAATMTQRGGYPGDLYVLALAGGTGVGKSSLLNAIAGAEVSAAGVRRPTTATPVAWLPARHRDEAAPLLAWIGDPEVRTREGDGPAMAIVDLPDLDSVEPSHAGLVDALLPRVDAVLWVTDPEKYDDAVLHDLYLRRWMPRLSHQAIALNKVDRLSPEDARRVEVHLRERLVNEALPSVPVLGVSALGDIGALREWLGRAVSAKEVVSGRLRSSARDAVETLAGSAGVGRPGPPVPLVTADAKAEAVSVASLAILGVLDPEGLRRQTTAATREAAGRVGSGPMARARSLIGHGVDVAGRRADPGAYLQRWRERGSLDRAVGAVRQLLLGGVGSLPPQIRPALALAAEPEEVRERLALGIDEVMNRPEMVLPQPTSRVWPLIGLGRTAALAAFIVGVIWQVALFAPGSAIAASRTDVPVLGPMPTSVLLILVGLFGWLLLGQLLRWHVDHLGGAWADSWTRLLHEQVTAVVAAEVDRLLGPLDAARGALWTAADHLRSDVRQEELPSKSWSPRT
jgi:hypothetical protein